MTIHLPSREVIKAIHKRHHLKFGDISLEGDVKKINTALAWSRMMVTTKAGADVFSVAVSLMMGIINEKPFYQGNTRLGFSLGVLTLRRNGWMLDISNAEALHLMNQIKGDNLEEGKVVEFFKRKSLRIEE